MREVEELLDRLDRIGAAQERVTVAEIRTGLGRDVFGSALLTLGLLALSPIGDIPGAPTVLGLFILGVGLQGAMGRRTLWIPRAVAGRSLRGRRLCTLAALFRPVVRVAGWVVRRRLTVVTDAPFDRVIAGTCAALALTLPPLEVVPFGATVPSSAITVFAVALVARDGLLALAACVLTFGGAWLLLDVLLDLAA